ncbi:11624_t:CDS:1, partial [Gigaspora margarita]
SPHETPTTKKTTKLNNTNDKKELPNSIVSVSKHNDTSYEKIYRLDDTYDERRYTSG